MPDAPASLTFREVLKITAVRRLWIAQVVSVFGDFLAIYAIYSIVSFRMHASATAVSLVLVFYLAPLAVISPIAGVFVDSWNVKRTMIASDLIRAFLFLLLLFAGALWQIYSILFLVSTVSSFFMPAQGITVRTLVPKEGLMSANALIQQAFLMMQIISPAVAGLLVSSFGPKSCFWIDSATFIASASMLSTLTIGREPSAAVKSLRSLGTELAVGAKFIFTHDAISFVVIAMTAGMFAIRCFGALIAVYVRDVLHGGSRLFGIIGSLVGFGMIAGTQLIRKVARKRSNAQVVTAGLAGIGFAIGLLAILSSDASTVVCTLAIGFFVAFIVVPAQVLLQEHTPANMLGRVGGSMMSVMFSSQVLAVLSAGALASSIGIRNVYLGSAALLFAIAGWGYTRLSKERPTAQTVAAS